MICHRCGALHASSGKPGRQELCLKCGAALRCCLNCRFYSETASRQCREDQADLVTDKAGPNFCDWFQPSEGRPISAASKAEEARKKLDQLFKG
jgi:hypothetical protein